MRAVLTNLGSLGTMQPMIALAVELRRCGHEVVLALPPYLRDHVKQWDLAFTGIGLDLDYRALQAEDTERTLRGEPPEAIWAGSLSLLDPMFPLMFEQLSEACRSASVLIGGHLQPVARVVHEITGIPFVSVQTNHFGGMQPRALREPAACVINRFRAQQSLSPLADPFQTDANSPQLALYALSRHLRPPPPDWPSWHHVTGFFFLDAEWRQASRPLLDFLDGGEPPVTIAFSSTTHRDSAGMTELIFTAIERAGCRAILQAGWGGLGRGAALPPRVFAAEFIPHTWLFPRASCVVHAGGSGVSAATLRAGVPSVVIPHIADQPLWGQVLRDAGAAAAVIPYQELSAERLAAAIVEALRNPVYREAARNLAQKIRAEQGVRRAAALIEDLLRRLGVVAATDVPQRKVSGAARQEIQDRMRKRRMQAVHSRIGSGAI